MGDDGRLTTSLGRTATSFRARSPSFTWWAHGGNGS